MERRRLWVAGAVGDIPTVVARTLNQAMVQVLRSYELLCAISEHGYTTKWTGGFVDGYVDHLRFTTLVHDRQLYVEQFDVELNETIELESLHEMQENDTLASNDRARSRTTAEPGN